MSSETSNALNAIGTLIGYIGTEVATDDFFDRLLWPRRSFNGFSAKHFFKMALLMPMGGPLHKAALSTLDDFYKHGLYERHELGHMLGTAFFRDTKLKYKAYGDEGDYEEEWVRNGLWTRAVMKAPFPNLRDKKIDSIKEGGDVPRSKQKVRQRICVGCLTLIKLSNEERSLATITDDAEPPTLRTYLAILTTELSAVIVAIFVAAFWKSPFAALWLLPLILKITSALFTVRREHLVIPEPSSKPAVPTRMKLFQSENPAGGFVSIEGDESLVLQFFRHHGHPIRSKPNEILQIATVVAFTLLFPLGLVCSTLWMANALQKMWVGYQLYATLALYVYRYAGGHLWSTTVEQIGDAFSKGDNETGNGPILLKYVGRNGAIGATLTRTCHERYGQGLEHMKRLIERRSTGRSTGRSWSQNTLVSPCKSDSSSSKGPSGVNTKKDSEIVET